MARETIYVFADKENYFIHNGGLHAVINSLDQAVSYIAKTYGTNVSIETGRLPPRFEVDARRSDIRILNYWEMILFKDCLEETFGNYTTTSQDFAEEEFTSKTSQTSALASILGIFK